MSGSNWSSQHGPHFGRGFRQIGALRGRRSELKYPERPRHGVSTDETDEAVANAQRVITSAQGLLDQLGLF